ncbi:MAG: hypothetical protein Q8P81_03990, partial [Nanoarchaeota archaeon]|nr:hypothetical protein [Nanoarchaeota archaeon]
MKKVVITLVLISIMFVALMNSNLILAQEDDSTSATIDADASVTVGSNDSDESEDNSGSQNTRDTETRTRTETDVRKIDGVNTKVREETRIRVRDGEVEKEVRVRAEGANAERIRTAIEARNRLRIHNTAEGSDSDLPEGCTKTGVVTRCELEDGSRQMTIQASSGNVIIINSGGENATTNATLYHHDGRVFAIFEGRNNDGESEEVAREIKIMPDEVRKKIRERIKAQIEEEEDNMELDEEGNYRVEVRKRAKLLGLFSIRER